MIAGIGAATGFVLAGWCSRTLVTVLNSGSLPVRIAVDLTFDWRVLLLATAVATFVCVLCGIGPALKVTRRDPVAAPPAASLLYGVRALDPMSFVLGITVLASVTLLAAWLPARRASKVAPIVALRE